MLSWTMNTVSRSLRSPNLPDDARDGRDEVGWMSPDVDVTSSLRFRQRDPDRAVGVAKLEPSDKRRTSFRPRDRLLVLEPVADASAEELGDTCPLRLVPAEIGLEITSARSFVLEQTMKRQPGSRHGNGDRCVTRKRIRGGRRKLHSC